MTTYSATAQSFRCEECNAEMAFPLFCDACGAWYPERQRMSPFGLLGLPVAFEVEDEALDRIELLLAQRLHPDRWHGRGERLHQRALLAQSAVNEALGKVKDPFVRAETLLDLHQGEVPSRPLPIAFLMEQLELQEEIEAGVDRDRKRELKGQLRGNLEALRGALSEAFTRWEAGDEAALIHARDAVDRSRYWRNAVRALRGRAPNQVQGRR